MSEQGSASGRTTLEVVAGPAAGQRLEVVDRLLLGRGEEGHGALAGDSELSRRHAQLLRLADGRVVVEDLASTNGTWVNGVRIPRPTLLAEGDDVTVGGSRLRVSVSEGQPADARPSAAAPAKRPGLRVVAGWAPGTQIVVGEGQLVLGSANGADEFGADPTLAPEHARVTPLDGGRVVLEDLGSGRGTSVGGHPIPAPTVLSLGDRFQIGGQTLEVIELAAAGGVSAATVTGGVQHRPEGLFRRIAGRAPVTAQEVRQTYALALGWAIAANLLIRTIALEVGDVPSSLRSITAVPFILATLLPVTFNAFGFSKIFRRPDHTSVTRYLIPTFVVPSLFVAVNVLRMNHRGFADYVTTIAVTIVPIMIGAPLMLRLRERVAAERLRQVGA